MPLIAPLISFCLACFMLYWIVADKPRWDEFWAEQNRGRPFAPRGWAESPVMRLLTYLFAVLLTLGGLMGMCQFFHVF
jgi:hypothetical protein